MVVVDIVFTIVNVTGPLITSNNDGVVAASRMVVSDDRPMIYMSVPAIPILLSPAGMIVLLATIMVVVSMAFIFHVVRMTPVILPLVLVVPVAIPFSLCVCFQNQQSHRHRCRNQNRNQPSHNFRI